MAADSPIDMSLWQGRIDPEPDSDRWHQRIQPLADNAPPGCVLIGFESDAGVARNQGRTGASEGPGALRRALAPLAWHRKGPAYDAGNVQCNGDALETTQQALADRLASILTAGHLPIVLGGGHEVAYASWRGLAQFFTREEPELEDSEAKAAAPRIGIINLDAHFDLRDPVHVRSSGTPFAQIAEKCQAQGWPFRYACLGVSRAANTQGLFKRAAELGTLIREDHEISALRLESIIRDLQRFIAHCDHVYLSIDLDVLPAAEAPGVSAPASHGVALALIEPLAEAIRDSGKLRLVDVAELNPRLDIDNRTARAAARLIHSLTLNS
ncbi:MAG: formimidoylglutamase [Halomonas sp.]|uniref:formimidoylglutamase n=1 Tax=Halomonas sp. TaxID=1486246 RepID=UPI003F8FCD63